MGARIVSHSEHFSDCVRTCRGRRAQSGVMRTTLLACCVLTVTTATANAQTTYVGPWQPRPTIGVALGASDYHLNNDRTNRLFSGTIEVPFSDKARLRIEAGRSAIRVPANASPEFFRFTGDARISRLTVSIGGLERPGDIASPYAGLGLGFYRLTHDNVKTPIKPGFYAHGGAEVPVSDSATLNFEIGVHVIPGDFIHVRSPSSDVKGDGLFEALLRFKVGL